MNIDYLHPRLRNHPDALDFADEIDLAVPDSVCPDSFGSGYAWEADIPPRSEWEREIKEFGAHVCKLWDEQGGTDQAP